MARERQIIVCALNFDATPHPDGIYLDLLRKASRFLVKAHGSDYAKITSPRKAEREEGIYYGRILVFTEIDVKGKWLDLRNEDELSPDLKRSIAIPANARPNFRSYDYLFSEKKHRFYFENRNTEGQVLGPTTAKRILSSLLSQELHGFNSPDVAVTVVPEKGAVERILRLPGLRQLYIRVASPNADSASPAVRRRVLKRLEEANARRLEITYTKRADAVALTPTQEMRELAEVGSDTGLVEGIGRDPDDKKLEISTDQIPKRKYVSVEAGGSFLARVLGSLGLF
jgi:hypothetical protein